MLIPRAGADPSGEYAMRPWIQMPTWDGKLVLAGILIIGYYLLVIIIVRGTPAGDLTASRAAVVHDALLTLGPPIGLVFGALFRSTGAEERNAALRSNELTTAIQTPSVVAGAANGTNEDTAGAVEDGARRGTRQGVDDAMNRQSPPAPPMAADGERRDWLDEPPKSDSQIPTDIPTDNNRPGDVAAVPTLED
jgi:hypothetical protein